MANLANLAKMANISGTGWSAIFAMVPQHRGESAPPSGTSTSKDSAWSGCSSLHQHVLRPCRTLRSEFGPGARRRRQIARKGLDMGVGWRTGCRGVIGTGLSVGLGGADEPPPFRQRQIRPSRAQISEARSSSASAPNAGMRRPRRRASDRMHRRPDSRYGSPHRFRQAAVPVGPRSRCGARFDRGLVR